ncbi:MAG TPA: hypothetical protein VFZ00_01920 [Solirubrobacter sp.]|nr:hypothetical protein [Solirubrobacter sp.]
MSPGNTQAKAKRRPRRKPDGQEKAREIVLRLDERTADAVLVVLDTAGRVDRRRGLRLVEAVATLIAFTPRFRREGRRREVQP